MPRFKCENALCADFGKEELIAHVRFVWNNDTMKLEAKEAACPTCQKQRSVVKEKGPIEIPWFKAENARNYENKKISRKLNEFNY